MDNAFLVEYIGAVSKSFFRKVEDGIRLVFDL
jgi:hypothetical protein